MVRSYKRKTERGSWSEEAMKNAVTEVINGRMGYYRAATTFQVPQTTLERKVKKFKSETNEVELIELFDVKSQLGPYKSVFTPEEEQDLVNYIKTMESRLFGLTANDVKRLAYQLAVRNNKQHNFNQTKESAGKDWLRGFLQRNPSLSFRKPEQTSAARAMAFNKVNVSKFFGLLGELYDQHKFTADRIYNCDESGISAVSKNTSKILASKGKKQVGSLSSAERGKTVSVEFCMSAAGSFMPPMLVYPRQRMKPELLNNCSPGMWAECHVSGWMQKHIFEKWFDKFIEFSKTTREKPVLLLLDGHSTHIQSLAIIDKARANGVVILCFPPHCTHRLQPLDVSFMKPLSTYYDQELTNWLRSNPGKIVTMFQIAEILGKAFLRAATMLTAINGFKKTGVCPYEPNIFPDSVFEASFTTDTPIATSEAANVTVNSDQGKALDVSQNQVGPLPESSVPVNQAAPKLQDALPLGLGPGLPGCSNWSVRNTSPNLAETPAPGGKKEFRSFAVSPEEIVPVPHVGRKNIRQSGPKRGKTVIVTSSPYKKELLDSVNKAKPSQKKGKDGKNAPKKNVKKSLFVNKGKSEKNKKTMTNLPKKIKKEKNEEGSTSEEEDTACLYCGYFYKQSTEGWVACISCKKWAHCSCAGEEDEDAEVHHICEFCKQKDDDGL